MFLPRPILERKLRDILAEDVGQGDITSALLIPSEKVVDAKVVVKEAGVIAGIEEARVFLEYLGLRAKALATDGQEVKAKQVIMKISGNARTLLAAERTLLNIISRMSGIATATRRIREKLRKAGLKTKVACTRKTAPGLLYFDKKAVLVGGGDAHRFHLDDLILIKDNHIAVVGTVLEAIERARGGASPFKKIEVEVTRPKDAVVAAKAGADIIMLDNFSPAQVRKTVEALKREKLYRKVMLEASGGITEETAFAFASAGVDVVSSGALTQGTRALNISLEISEVSGA